MFVKESSRGPSGYFSGYHIQGASEKRNQVLTTDFLRHLLQISTCSRKKKSTSRTVIIYTMTF